MEEQRPAAAGTDRSQAEHRSAQNWHCLYGEPHPVSQTRPQLRCCHPRIPHGNVTRFTVDVEDWHQSCIDYDAPITERVVRTRGRQSVGALHVVLLRLVPINVVSHELDCPSQSFFETDLGAPVEATLGLGAVSHDSVHLAVGDACARLHPPPALPPRRLRINVAVSPTDISAPVPILKTSPLSPCLFGTGHHPADSVIDKQKVTGWRSY